MIRFRSRVLFLFLVAGVSGCLWRGYERVMTIHLEVLEGTALKMIDKAVAGNRLDPNDVTEMMYPLQKARQFAHRYRADSALESLRRFNRLLEEYESLSNQIDAARGDEERWAALVRILPERRVQTTGRVAAVREALAAE